MTIFALPKPVVVAAGATQSLQQILRDNFGDSLPTTWTSVSVSYASSTETTRYWNDASPVYSYWTINGAQVDADAASLPVPISDIGNVDLVGGNRLGRTVSINVGGDTYIVNILPPEWVSEHTLPGTPVVEDLTKQAVKIAAEHQSKYGYARPADSDDSISDIAAAAGAPLPALSNSPDPYHNLEGGYWRISYRSNDFSDNEDGWYSELEVGDIVVVATPVPGETRTFIVLDAASGIDGSSYPYKIFYDGSNSYYFATYPYLQDFETLGVYTPLSYPVTIYRLAKDGLYLINGTSGADDLYGSNMRDEIRGLGGDDRFFVAVQGEAMNGGAGHDVLDGGEGVDLAVFELSLEHYHIEESGTGFSILSLDDESEGVDLLQNIEYARFGSEVYALSHMVGGARGKPISVSFDAYDPIAPQSSPREVAGKVVGHDFDPRGLLNYSIVGGADAGLFRIDSATGEIRFINAPQESSHDYAIEVRVADGAVVSVNLEVHIVTAAEPGPKVVTGSPEDDHLSGSIRDDSMSGQAGNDMLDGLGGDDVLNGGEGDDTLDGGDGVDVAVLELSKDQYTIEQEDDHYVIQAIGDGAEGRDLLTNMEYVKFGADTYSVAELVDNVSAKPISVSFSAPDFIADNIKPRTVIGTAIAHDFAANHELTYSITGGADASHFGINSETGEIWFIDSPQGGQPVFEIEVQVSDGDVVSASVAVRIETFVLNQFYPVNGSPDGEKLLGSMRNDLISGGDGDDVIDALGGDDSVIGGVGDDTVYGGDGVDMVVFALPKANYGIGKEGDHYIIQLLAGGAEGRDVVFDVEYAQFGAEIYSLPSLAGGGVNNPISATFERNVFAVGTSRPDDVVGRISAHDFAPNASLRYSILANGSAPVFEVDAETGEVRFIDPAQIASGDYVVKLHVADGFAVGVTVEVLIKAFAASDFNTVNGTQDSEELAGSIRTDIISGQGGDDIIYGLAGDDFVSGDAGDDILSGDAGDDTLDGGAGVDVAVLGSSRENYDVVREGDHYVVQALDDGSDGRDVLFNVEYVKFGADTYFLANLVDTGAHNPISATFKSLGFVVGLSPSYEVVSQVIGHDFDPSAKLTYSIIGEDNQNLFTIDAGTGSIRFIEAPQLANEDYTIEVRVSDGDAVGVNLQVHIKTFDTDYLNPVNGTSGDDSLTGTTRKDILMGYEGNDTIRGLPGDDVVIGGAGDDSLFGGQGVDVAVYDLSWDHYEVSRDESDYFTNFYVNAIDGGTEGRDVLTNIEYVKFGDQIFALKELYGSVTATPISITVDPLPSITDQAGAGEVVATAKAHHFDPEALGYLKYSIVGGADAFRFQIDTQTGEISFRENYYVTDETGMDVEVLMNEPGAHVYDIIVQVNDGSLVQSSVDVKIETAGMHSAPVFLSARTAGVSDVIAKSGVVYRAIAVDEEADGAVSYVIVDGDDKDLFEINPRTGEVRFKQDAWNLDPAGRGHDNHYHIVIQATYYGVSSTSEVEITVVPDKSQRSEHVTLPDDAYVSGLLNGSKWSTKDPDEPKKTVITYSFPKTDAVYQDPYGQLPSDANSSQPFSRFVEALKSFSPVGEVLQKAIVRFLDQYSLIANVSFVSVDGTGADGSTPQADLQFGFSDSLPPYVYGMAAFADKEFIAGDIWVNGVAASYVGDMQSLETVGSVFFETMYHEIGHALGLQHPYSTERETPGDHWTADYTIMLPVLGLGVASEQKNFGFKSGNAAQSPMMDDIRALQVLYGANYKAHSGNTTYRWVSKTGRQTIDDNDGAGAVSQGVPSANVVFVTVWDGDGIDTYDFSNYETDMTIDLQPGGWSVISDSQLARSSGGKATAIGNVFNAYLYNDDPRSLIENAIGGSGNDSITGNQAANHLWGMAGDDRLFGLEGDDTLDGGAGNDQIDGGDGFDTAIIHAKFTDSTIVRNDDGSLTVTTRQGDVETISHVEYLMFSDLGVQVTPLTGLRLKIESGDTASIPENVSSSDVVYTLVASDPDVNAHLTYSLSGADASLFAINDRGEVTFVASPDYEGGQKVYHITVDVADGPVGGVNTLTASKAVTITVSDVNEAPSITSGSVGAARENDAASTVVYTAVASDPDANAHLTYSLSGADASLFAINDRSEVTFVASPDYEGGQKVYHITVDVADGPAGGLNTLSTSKPVTINVSDVNEAPSITSGSVGSARENDAALTVVYKVVASDPDANAHLTYSLSGADASLFAINDRGEVTFVASPDYEGGQKVYHITVEVADGPAGGLNTLTASKPVTITVSDVNEAPSITSGSVGSARENDAASTVVYTVLASDPDANAHLTYSLSGADASLFAINDRGEVTFVASPDYEGGQKVYHITVDVADGPAGGVNTLTASRAITINVSDVNEAPSITSGSVGSARENDVASTVVYTVLASDPDANAHLTYALSGADASLFAINDRGEVTFVASPDYEGGQKVYHITVEVADGPAGGLNTLTASKAVTITVSDVNEAPSITSGSVGSARENDAASTVVYTVLASDPDANAHLAYSLSGADASLFAINDRGEVTFVASPDYEGGQKVYHITVDVADGPAGGVNTLTVSKPVTINVGDVNETPSITSGSVGSARENDAASTVVYTLVASDPDANAHLTYSLSGADASLFAINDRGEVTFVASPDYEGGQKVYHITVDVADGPAGGVNTLTASKPVTITVSDVNEAPSITSGSVGAARENDAASTVVYTVLASDPDANANLTYALSGADSSLFAINDRGEVTFVASPDYEGGQKVYHIMVDVADGPAGGLNTLSASKAVTINVSDVNEAPSITSGSVGSARENDAASTVVYKVVASDPDANANLTYALSGADASLFAINDRGEVTFVASPDYEDPKDAGRDNSYDIVVKVSDGLLSSTKAVAITVSNRNDTPPHLTGGSGNDTLTGTTKGDKFFGGAGIDTVSYADSESSVAVDLLKPINNSGDAAGDTYVSANLFLGAETVSVKVPNFGPGAGAWLSNDRYPRSLVDINNDGKLDIVGFGEAQVYAALGDGKGGFGAVNPVAGLSGFTPVGGGWNSSDRYPRLFADVNNDGLVDAVGFGEAQVFVARGLGGGVFGEMTPNATLSNLTPRGGGWSSNDRYPRFLVDVNGDGNIDAVGFGEEHVFAALGDGKGNFAQAKPIAGLDGFTSKGGGWNSNDVFPRMFGDVNGDGNLDVIGFGWAKVWVSLGDGKGSFQPMTGVVENFTAGAGGWVNSKTYPRFVSDMNGDGMADLVGFGEAGVYVSLATGGGNFAAPQLVFNNLGRGDQAGGWVNNDLYPRLLGDLNGDGASDIAGFGYAGVYTVINGVDRVENATGSAFGDRLSGDNGANVLTGGGGADTLAGRGGADTFVYTAVLDSTAAAADTITDFEHGIDKIDLSQIDINASQAGRQGFHFGATTTGAITAGDLVYDAATGVLSGYVDGDAVPDFQIILANKAALSAGDFVL